MSLITRETQIKTTMRYHITPVRVGIINKRVLARMWGRGDPCTLTVGGTGRLVQPLWNTVWRFLKKLKTELPYDPAISLLGVYPERYSEILIQKDICIPMFFAVLFTITKIRKQPRCPWIDDWLKKNIPQP